MSGAAVELLPAGSFDPAYIGRVVAELESRGWKPDSRGEPDCADEASAAGADIIRAYSAELQQCREALEEFVAAHEKPRYADAADVKYPVATSTFHKEWGGGDCSRHGRWYGVCHGCMEDNKAASADADRAVANARNAAIETAYYSARAALKERT